MEQFLSVYYSSLYIHFELMSLFIDGCNFRTISTV